MDIIGLYGFGIPRQPLTAADQAKCALSLHDDIVERLHDNKLFGGDDYRAIIVWLIDMLKADLT